MPVGSHDINILIAHDKEIYRKGIIYAFSKIIHFHVFAQASTFEELCTMAGTLQPDIVITSHAMQQVNCVDRLCALALQLPGVSFIVYGDCTDGYQLAMLRQAGIMGIVQMGDEIADLLDCVQAVYDGEKYFDKPSIALMNKADFVIKPCKKGKIRSRFNDSELSVMDLTCKEFTVQEIAAKTFHSVDAIKSIRKKLLTKTGSKGSCGIVRFAVRNAFFRGLIIIMSWEWSEINFYN